MKNGHIDIAVRASTHRERQLLNEIRRRGLTLQRVGDSAVRLIGPGGLCTMASDLSLLSLDDVQKAGTLRRR